MRHTLQIAALASALLLCGCGGGSSDTTKIINNNGEHSMVIDIENPTMKEIPELNQLIDTAYLITFKGKDLLLSDDISPIITGDRICLYDYRNNKSIKIFDIDGNFIREVPKGNGPGEIDQCYDRFYDPNNKFFLISNSEYWSKFDCNGNFIDKIKIPFKYMRMCKFNDEYIFLTNPYNDQQNTEINGSVIITDTNFNIKRTFVKKAEIVPEIMIHPNTAMAEVDGHLWILNDTIYRYENSNLYPEYCFKIDNPLDPAAQIDIHNLGDTKGYRLSKYLENSRTQIVEISEFSGRPKHLYRDKKSGNSFAYLLGQDGTYPFYINANFLYNDCFVTSISSERSNDIEQIKAFLSPDDQKIINDLTPDDNPVLLLFKMKEF